MDGHSRDLNTGVVATIKHFGLTNTTTVKEKTATMGQKSSMSGSNKKGWKKDSSDGKYLRKLLVKKKVSAGITPSALKEHYPQFGKYKSDSFAAGLRCLKLDVGAAIDTMEEGPERFQPWMIPLWKKTVILKSRLASQPELITRQVNQKLVTSGRAKAEMGQYKSHLINPLHVGSMVDIDTAEVSRCKCNCPGEMTIVAHGGEKGKNSFLLNGFHLRL